MMVFYFLFLLDIFIYLADMVRHTAHPTGIQLCLTLAPEEGNLCSQKDKDSLQHIIPGFYQP